MQEEVEPQVVKILSPYEVRKPAPQDALVVTFLMWESLTERIRSCKVSTNFWSVTYSVAFGAGYRGLIHYPHRVYPDSRLGADDIHRRHRVGLGIGVVSLIAEKSCTRQQHSDIDLLVAEMERTREPFTG